MNDAIRNYVDFGSRIHVNCIRHDPNTTDSHKDKVEEICRYLRKNKIDFVCRPSIEVEKKDVPYQDWLNAEFVMPDVLAFTVPRPTAIEILESETIKHVKEKFKLYPLGIRTEWLTMKDSIEDLGLT
jgi:hypothetical protein